jgi:cytochrome c-type biogenesis protein CcmH
MTRFAVNSSVGMNKLDGMKSIGMNNSDGMNKSGRVACPRPSNSGRKRLFLTCSSFLTCSIPAFVTILLICLVVPVAKAQVQEEEVPSDDPVIEQRLANLSKELRCLQCQNQTLADSPAGLAADLRREIRVQMKAGKSDQEVVAFLTQRYGDFILYRPRVTFTTYLLWFGPFVLLLAGLYLLFHYIKRRRDLIPEEPLSADERRRAEELLASFPRKETT